MEQLRKDFCNEVFKIIGKRKKDGCCAFCGEKLSENEYCDCPQAEKSNKYFKKVCRVLERIDNYIVLGTPIRKVRKSLNITSNTIERPVRKKIRVLYAISKLKAVRNGRFLHFKGWGTQFFIPKADFKRTELGEYKEKRKKKGKK